MNLPTPPPSAPVARRVPYAYASPLQLSRALLFVLEATEDHYPDLPWESWVQVLLTVQPDLWVTPQTVYLDNDSLKQVRRCLYAYLTMEVVEHWVLGPRAPYFAQQLVDHQDDAIDALDEIEGDPLACPPAIYRLVTGVAAGDKVAHEVYEATEPSPHQRPRSEDRDRARAAVPGRLQALRDARGEPTSDRYPRSR